MKTFQDNTFVKVGTAKRIPLRYQGRTGLVVGRTGRGRTIRYLVDFGTRRATPLEVSPNQLTLVS